MGWEGLKASKPVQHLTSCAVSGILGFIHFQSSKYTQSISPVVHETSMKEVGWTGGSLRAGAAA